MKKIIKITFISLLILLFILPLIIRLFAFSNTYLATIFYSVLINAVILNYFYELYKSDLLYWKVILIAFLIPIVLYNVGHLYNFVYYNYTESGQIQLKEILPSSDYVMSSGARNLGFQSFHNPFEYSLLDSLTQKSIYKISNYYYAEQYSLIFLTIISFPIILLTFFSRYLIFKKLNLNPYLSLIFPFNYFLLINKFELPKKWKIYLLLPIVNIVCMYNINIRVVKLFNLPNSTALGLLFLPFIFYPKIAFEKKNFYDDRIIDNEN